MKIFFDESGQSGCVLQKNDLLNFQSQPTFAIGAVLIKNDKDALKLVKKYEVFKEKFHVEGEIKGSDMLTKEHNGELEYFLKNILDRYHFFVLLYDKRFYLSTLLLLSVMGLQYKNLFPKEFYTYATMLSQQKDDFFIRYLKYIENPNPADFSDYLNYLINYKYINFEGYENNVVLMARQIIDANEENEFYNDFLTFGNYDNPKITNLINLTALSELVYFIKSQTDISNKEIEYIHDHIKEFEDTFQNELSAFGINISFSDSKEETLLQVADNFISILRHAYDKGITHIQKKEMWEDKNKWDMELLSHVIRKTTHNHISFTVSLNDWAASLCVEKMFDSKYPKKYRNNINFNYCYQENLLKNYVSISENNHFLDEDIKLLEK
ncbi:MAG: DUF3800 domain-containing protein [Oscillospiraceae bacterium]|nr:DUF3800 domain-containing protein [Oscillospiraceae bacterium]